MSVGTIVLNPALSAHDHQLLTAWLLNPRGISSQDWPRTLAAFDHLRSSQLEWAGERITFSEFYNRWVEERYATPFIAELLELTELETEGYQTLAGYAQRIKQELAGLMVNRSQTLPERLLFAYCLYWWNAFGKGYIFEAVIFADLAIEGIAFQSHDLRVAVERYSPDDLMIPPWHGDVKTSTYFLSVARSFPLHHDFYITRLFIARSRNWQRIVLTTPAMWTTLGGESPEMSSLEDIKTPLIIAVAIQTRGETLVAIDYDVWKRKMKAYQHIEEGNSNAEDA